MDSFDEKSFLLDLSQQPCSNLNSFTDPSATLQFFNNTFLFVLNKHAALKRKRVHRPQQPGLINIDSLDANKNRNTIHSQTDNNNYTLWRNIVKVMIVHSKQEFFYSAINLNVHHHHHHHHHHRSRQPNVIYGIFDQFTSSGLVPLNNVYNNVGTR